MQDNAAQHWLYSTILAVTTIPNTDKFAKIVHTDLFVENVGRNPDHSISQN